MTKILKWSQYLGFAADGLAAGVTGPILYLIRAEFGMTYAQTGRLLSIQNLVILLMMAAAGYLLDRLGKKALLLTGGALLASGLLGSVWSWDYASLIAFSVVWCVGYGFWAVGFNAVCADMNGNGGNAMNRLHFFYGIGAVLAPITSTVCIAVSGNWRTVFILPCALALGVFILLARLPAESRPPKHAGRPPVPIRNGYLWVSGIFAFVYVSIEVAVQGWLPTFWSVTMPQGLVPATLITTFFWAAVTAGRYLTGKIVDRVRLSRYLVTVSLATAAVSFLWLFVHWEPAVYVVILIMGLLIGGVYPTIMASTNARFPGMSGVVASFISTVSGIAGFLLPNVIGGVADAFGIVKLPLIVAGLGVLLFGVAIWRTGMAKRELSCVPGAGQVQCEHE